MISEGPCHSGPNKQVEVVSVLASSFRHRVRTSAKVMQRNGCVPTLRDTRDLVANDIPTLLGTRLGLENIKGQGLPILYSLMQLFSQNVQIVDTHRHHKLFLSLGRI